MGQLFQVSNWPRLPDDLTGTEHPEIEQYGAQAREWMRQLTHLLDETLQVGGGIVAEASDALSGYPYLSGAVIYAGGDGRLAGHDYLMWSPTVTRRLTVGKATTGDFSIRVNSWDAAQYLQLRNSPGWCYAEAVGAGLGVWADDDLLLYAGTAGHEIIMALGGILRVQDRDAAFADRLTLDSATGSIWVQGDLAWDAANERLSLGGMLNDYAAASAGIYMEDNSYCYNVMVGNYPIWDFNRINGTTAAPTAALANDILGNIRFGGYHSGGAMANAEFQMRCYATENWTALARGTKLQIWGTFTGTIATGVWLTLDNRQVQHYVGSAALPTVASVTNPTDGLYWQAAGFMGATTHFCPSVTETKDLGQDTTPLWWRYLWATEVAAGNCNAFEALIAPGQNITVGADKLGASFIAPWDLYIVRAQAFAQVAPTDGDIILDANINGATIWPVQAQRLRIVDGANAGNTSTFGVSFMAQDDRLTWDVDNVGGTVAGANVSLAFTFIKADLI